MKSQQPAYKDTVLIPLGNLSLEDKKNVARLGPSSYVGPYFL